MASRDSVSLAGNRQNLCLYELEFHLSFLIGAALRAGVGWSAIRKVAWIKAGIRLRASPTSGLADQSFAQPLSLVATLAFSRLIVAWEPTAITQAVARELRRSSAKSRERAGVWI